MRVLGSLVRVDGCRASEGRVIIGHRDLINEIRALRLDSYGIAERLRSWQIS
ncbi:hypothetical protein [Streptomyces sp. NPDC085665]|uniref:hypothetical protein n=1 Tax=Streptomyces sp. NPDC085665 TaxID=3365735 RepID=UPI0037D5B1F6